MQFVCYVYTHVVFKFVFSIWRTKLYGNNQPFLEIHGYYNSSVIKKYVSYKSPLDYNVYHTTGIENFGTYVSVKYQLNDAIIQYIDGCNPLFI